MRRTSSMSRSFHLPGPAFWPSGAAKSMMRAAAQSSRQANVSAINSYHLREYTDGNPKACNPAWMCKGSDHHSARSSIIDLVRHLTAKQDELREHSRL
jgi:hypothetical protein